MSSAENFTPLSAKTTATDDVLIFLFFQMRLDKNSSITAMRFAEVFLVLILAILDIICDFATSFKENM